MTTFFDVEAARKDIEATTDIMERSIKLAGLLTSLYQWRGFPMVLVGSSVVDFYTKDSTKHGGIDLCRKSLKAVPLRMVQEVADSLKGTGCGRKWTICGLEVNMLGMLESDMFLPERLLPTPYGAIKMLPPELALVQYILYADQDGNWLPTALRMMKAALADPRFNWGESRRIAALSDFAVSKQLVSLKEEVSATNF